MSAHDRVVAGLRCTQVLDDLSDYFDGDLPPERVARIDAHLAGCDWCERFGGDFAGAITALRERLAAPAPPAPSAHARLMARLEERLE